MRARHRSETLVPVVTAYSPTSIKIRKESYKTIYPNNVPREINIVFPSKSKTAMVDRPIAEYLVKTYPFITMLEQAEEQETVKPKEVNLTEEAGETNDQKPVIKGTTGKGRRPTRKL
jgi:hypothetical protein